ncbi:outer membrane receptor protein involved in Fe transport [Rhizomicrobium palustre]|uniref:Outer membrane receptor protein involved in Fe transport n=1 Tax=Rhizomicrobium palustre TaxID=189966 RepID=A0A846N387_9PROT|nr:TonB-dependent receptor [Rhizomicrobium palustre]NIK90438.1 outer membrane receptor protein involved in Fe transport [Rhizomicrobium palustre]
MPIRFHAVSLAVLAAAMLPAAAEMADSQNSFIETVTVTAQKRVQNPIEVPMALTAYSGDFLKKIDAQEFDKLSLYTPGFVVQNQSPNNPGLVLRGLTLDSGDSSQEPRVSVFEDDVSISTTRATYIELFDIERVEVARGPQTTLFGRAALMGGVNVIQNKADPSAKSFALGAEAGDYGYWMAEGMANIPLSDDFAVRVSGRAKTRQGYVKNLLGGADYNSVGTIAGRLAFNYKPTDALNVDVIFNYESDKPSGTSFKSGTFAPFDPNTGAVLGNLDHNSGAALTTVPGFENNKQLGLDRKVWDAKALVSYTLTPAVKLSSVTAYRRFDSEEVFDPDGFSQPLLVSAEDARGDQFSQELRVNYDDGGRFSAFGGVDYFYSNVSQRVPLQFDERLALTLLTGQNPMLAQPTAFFSTPTFVGGYAPALVQGLAQGLYFKNFGTLYAMPAATAAGIAKNLKANHWEQSENFGKTKSVDLYADVTVKVTEAFELEGGVRYTTDDKVTSYAATTADRSVLGGLIGAMSLPAPMRDAVIGGLATPGAGSTSAIPASLLPAFALFYQPTANNGDKIAKGFSDDGLTWRFSARYALDKDLSLYANYARGRRPKVLTALTPSQPFGPPNFSPADAETVDSYEVGAKTEALDGKLHADIAVYTYQYANFQTVMMLNNTPITTNAGHANAWGIESQLEWAITDWADFFGTYAYNRARFAGTSMYKGNQFRLNPDHKLSAGLALHTEMFGGTVTLLPTYTFQSKIYFDDDNDIAALQTGHLLPDTKQDELQKSYGLFNARLSYAPENAIWSASVFVNNVFNRKYIKDAGNAGDNLGIPTFIAGEPRFFGVAVALKTH